MFSKKNWCLMTASISVVILSMSSINAQAQTCPFSLASLQGYYAVVITYGANVGMGLQSEHLDGKGNLTRTGIINQPVVGSTTGARSVTPVTSVGTYTVNCDGTGTITRTVTRADGTTADTSDDFIITKSEFLHGWPWTAISITDVQRDPSVIVPGGIFTTRVHTRLPDR